MSSDDKPKKPGEYPPKPHFIEDPSTDGQVSSGRLGKSVKPSVSDNVPRQELGNPEVKVEELEPLEQLETLQSDLDEVQKAPSFNPIDEFSDSNLGLSSQEKIDQRKPGESLKRERPSREQMERAYGKPEGPVEKGVTSGIVGDGDDEKKKLSDFINKERSSREGELKSKLSSAKSKKVGRFNMRGRLKKRARVIAISLLVTVFTAGPLAILGAVPHAIQSWIENRVSAYTQRASEKIGQKLLYEFIRNRVAINSCKGYYNSMATGVCTPRLGERRGLIKDLFDDWEGAKMEDALKASNISVEYNPSGFGAGPGKPYRLSIAGEGFDFADVMHSDWNALDVGDAAGRREFSKILKRETKAVLKKETKWWQFLKRRNMKAGYFRKLNLPRKFFGPDTLARKLDEREERKRTRRTRWRQHLTKRVVKVGDGRLAGLIEILFDGSKLKDKTAAEIRESNAVLRALADKIGDAEVLKLIDKYAGKTGSQIALEVISEVLEKILARLGVDVAVGAAGEAASKFIPVIGQIMLAFAILDLIDLATDGTLQKYLSVQNAQAMMDMSNLMDTTLSEEKRGYVDAVSAGDLRLSLIKGLGSSRVFTNTVGYTSPSGKKAAGYNCRPNVTVSDMSSIFEAGQSIFNNGADNLDSAGMAANQDTCENHRVDYDPTAALGAVFGGIQGALYPYTKACALDLTVGGLPIFESITDLIPGVDCPSMQEVYHGVNGAINWLSDKIIGPLFSFFLDIPFIKSIMGNIMGWITNGIAVLITGYSLTGPDLLQGGLRTDIPSGAKIFDAWSGGQQATQNDFMRGVGDGGGLGGVPGTTAQTAKLNEAIALERKEELQNSSFFARMFDITHSDTLASGVMSMALVEGGTENLINPLKNIATIFSSGNKTTFADSVQKGNCTDENKKGKAVTEFGVVCNIYPDEAIDGLTDAQLEEFADPDYCKNFTAELEAKTKKYEEEDYFTSTHQYPDGSGMPDQVNPCRLLCSVTDSTGTFARTNDPICGFESFESADSTGTSSGGSGDPVRGGSSDPGSGECSGVPVTRPNEGKDNDVLIQIVPGTGIDHRADLCQDALAMIQAAAADGVTLDGGGFRTYDEQVALRRSNCGTSEYQIYRAPSSSCTPPTARPGQSNHETGEAIDFSNCKTRGTACYKWLAANAAKFGYYNLPSEPWHWSRTGG